MHANRGRAPTQRTPDELREQILLDSGAVVWVDRTGSATLIPEIEKAIDKPRLSSDGRRLAFRTPAPNCGIWVHDLERGLRFSAAA